MRRFTDPAPWPDLPVFQGEVLVEHAHVLIDETTEFDKGAIVGAQPAGLIGLLAVDELHPIAALRL